MLDILIMSVFSCLSVHCLCVNEFVIVIVHLNICYMSVDAIRLNYIFSFNRSFGIFNSLN